MQMASKTLLKHVRIADVGSPDSEIGYVGSRCPVGVGYPARPRQRQRASSMLTFAAKHPDIVLTFASEIPYFMLSFAVIPARGLALKGSAFLEKDHWIILEEPH